jgi:hypothetical protein
MEGESEIASQPAENRSQFIFSPPIKSLLLAKKPGANVIAIRSGSRLGEFAIFKFQNTCTPTQFETNCVALAVSAPK